MVSRRIVGWRVASTLESDTLPLQTLDMAAWNDGGNLAGRVHQADHGSNNPAVVCEDRIVELGAKPSTRSVSGSSDKALAEAVNGAFNTDLIHRRGPSRTVEQVELATLGWVR